MGSYTVLNISGAITRSPKIGVFYLLTQKMRSTRSTVLEFCGKFTIYGHPDLISFLIVAVTGNRSY